MSAPADPIDRHRDVLDAPTSQTATAGAVDRSHPQSAGDGPSPTTPILTGISAWGTGRASRRMGFPSGAGGGRWAGRRRLSVLLQFARRSECGFKVVEGLARCFGQSVVEVESESFDCLVVGDAVVAPIRTGPQCRYALRGAKDQFFEDVATQVELVGPVPDRVEVPLVIAVLRRDRIKPHASLIPDPTRHQGCRGSARRSGRALQTCDGR